MMYYTDEVSPACKLVFNGVPVPVTIKCEAHE